jgi:hypothetical protein
VFDCPDALPPLSPRAQLVWLGFEAHDDAGIISAALDRLFPGTSPADVAAAHQEAADHFQAAAHGQLVVAAAFRAWHAIETRRGRAADELRMGAFIYELDLLDHGRVELDRLKRVADPELRKATIAAVRQAVQQDEEAATAAPYPKPH